MGTKGRVRIQPRGFWAESRRRKVAWAVNRVLARIEKRAETKPIKTHEARLTKLFERALRRIDWEAWARANIRMDEASGKFKPLDPSLPVPVPAINHAGLTEELEALGRSAAAVGWERGQAVAQRVKKSRWSRKDDDFATIGLAETAAMLFVPMPNDIFAEAMADTFANVSGIEATTRKQMRVMMLDTMAASDTFSDFARQLNKQIPEISRQRAQTIAVTEYRNVASQATRHSYEEAGLTQKKWNTVGDNKVCIICATNEAQGPIPIGNEFESGHQNPSAHPHCRCNISGAR